MASIRSTGTVAVSANSVANPTTLAPGLPGTRVAGDILLLFTSCRAASGTSVATPSGWTRLSEKSLSGRQVIFARLVDGSETAPSVVWSGLTTGTTGSPVMARIACVSGVSMGLDVDGATANNNSATVGQGGAALTTGQPGSVGFAFTMRQDDAGTWALIPTADGITWAAVFSPNPDPTTSGGDMSQGVQWGAKATAGSVAATSFSITSGVLAVSEGHMMFLLAERVGTLSSTLATFSTSAAGTVLVQGDESSILATLSLSADGTVPTSGITGDLSATLAALALSSAGAVLVQGTETNALGVLSGSATGTALIQGSASNVLGTFSGTSTGIVLVQGTLAKTLASFAISSAGAVLVTGSESSVLTTPTLTGVAVNLIQGALAKQLGAFTLVADGGAPAIVGNLAQQLTNVKTNWFLDPSFESGTDSWARNLGTESLPATDTAQAHSGTHSLKLTTPGNATAEGYITKRSPVGTAAQGQTWRFGVWVYSATGGEAMNFQLDERNSAGSGVGSTVKSVTLVAGWQYVLVERTFQAASAAQASGKVVTNGAQAVTLWLDDGVLTQSVVGLVLVQGTAVDPLGALALSGDGHVPPARVIMTGPMKSPKGKTFW